MWEAYGFRSERAGASYIDSCTRSTHCMAGGSAKREILDGVLIVYYGRFDGELQLGIYIKRAGATTADFEYVLAVPTRPWLPGACEARAREGPFICDVRS